MSYRKPGFDSDPDTFPGSPHIKRGSVAPVNTPACSKNPDIRTPEEAVTLKQAPPCGLISLKETLVCMYANVESFHYVGNPIPYTTISLDISIGFTSL